MSPATWSCATGAALRFTSARAEKAEYAFVAMNNGDALDFPGLRLQVLETPGHTIESISILVYDMQRDPEQPCAVLTGDTLFIGDVGRPDLRASLGWTAAELGSHLYDSVQNQLLPLPDGMLIYPAHGAGSLCGKNISKETVSTMGEQRRFNYALQPMTREQFIAIVTADQPDAPPYFTWDAVLNTRERTTLEPNLEQVLQPLELGEFLGWRARARRCWTCGIRTNLRLDTWPGRSTLGWMASTRRGRARCSIPPARSC